MYLFGASPCYFIPLKPYSSNHYSRMVKSNPPAVLMGCWRILLFFIWCKILYLELSYYSCNLERLGYFSLGTWLLFPFDLVNWLPFCPALGYFYMFFIFNMRCLFAPRFAPNYVIRRIRSIYKLTHDRLAVYLQSGSFFQLIGIPILWIGMTWELVSNNAFTFSWIDLLPLTALQR